MFSLANAAIIDKERVSIDLKDDGTADFEINIEYPEEIENSDYFIRAQVSNVIVKGGSGKILDCEIEEMDIGTSIICRNIKEKSVTYKFIAYNLIQKGKKMNIFSHQFSITDVKKVLEIMVKIPMGTALVEEERLEFSGLKPFYPENGIEGSDGRRIFIKWIFENPKLGENINVIIVYEQIVSLEYNIIFYALLIIFFATIFVFIFFWRYRNKAKSILPILTESEREVMKIVLNSKNVIDQRKIVKETGFSKSKVSRILKNLEERGIIKREKIGRSTKVKFVFGKKKSEEVG
jgi:DNA-binding MarR family transcriptional regulator